MKPAPKKRGGPPPACEPADYAPADIIAVQTLFAGVASENQQKRAAAWFINNACATYELSYRPGDACETAFGEGRRFAGLQTLKMLRLSVPGK
jgi:hypothetical protein